MPRDISKNIPGRIVSRIAEDKSFCFCSITSVDSQVEKLYSVSIQFMAQSDLGIFVATRWLMIGCQVFSN